MTMEDRPFWEKPRATWTYESLIDFLKNEIEEFEQIDYKEEEYGKQNQKPEITERVLDSLVALANTSGGMLFYGVAEKKGVRTNKPGEVKGVKAGDPEGAIRSKCAEWIEPTIQLDIKCIDIPSGDHAGNKVVLIRVPRGINPPYSHRTRGVLLRSGEQNRQARIRDLEALFSRRPQLFAAHPTPWTDIQRDTFQYAIPPQADKPPALMVNITPASPILPISLDEASDEQFMLLCQRLFKLTDHPGTDSHFVWYVSGDQADTGFGFMRAYDDGTIGIRAIVKPVPPILHLKKAGVAQANEGRISEALPQSNDQLIDVVSLWREARSVLTTAEEWARKVCGYEGSLLYRIGLGNLNNVMLVLPLHMLPLHHDAVTVPKVPRRLPSWAGEGEWTTGESVDAIIGQQFRSLARQLQCRFFNVLSDEIRDESYR